jgi:hypothetical protein
MALMMSAVLLISKKKKQTSFSISVSIICTKNKKNVVKIKRAFLKLTIDFFFSKDKKLEKGKTEI